MAERKRKMNKLFSKIAALSVGLAMAVGVGVAVGSQKGAVRAKADDTVDFTLSSAASVTEDGVTVSFDKASGSNAPAWYAAGLRLYAKNTVTVSSSESITSIVFDWEKQGTKDFATVTADVGTYSHPSAAGQGTWSGSENSVVFTLGASGQLQLNTLHVTYASTSSTFTVTYDANGGSGTMTDTHEYESGDSVTVMYCQFLPGDDFHEFDSFNTKADGSGTSYMGGGTFNITKNVTLYAQWQIKDVTLANGSYSSSVSYVNPMPKELDVLDSSDAKVGLLEVDTTDVTYKTQYSEFDIAANKSLTITNHSNATITAVLFEVYNFDNIDVFVDGSTTAMHSGDGSNVGDHTKIQLAVNATSTVEIKCNGGNNGSRSQSFYGFEVNMKVGSEVIHPSSVTLNASEGFVFIGKTRQLSANVLPVDADDRSVTWSSDNDLIAEVDASTGVVTGVAAGETTITATTTDGGLTASFIATVKTLSYGTLESPLSVEEARDVLDLTGSSLSAEKLYVSGVVYSSEYDSTYSNYKVWLKSSDGETNKFFELYATNIASAYDDSNFTYANSLKGAEVVCYGYGQVYNSTYELNRNGDDHPEIKAISYTADSFAATVLSETKETCDAYVDGETEYASQKAALEPIWTSLSVKYDTLSSDEKDLVIEAERSETGSTLEKAMARYDYLTGKYQLDNFIEGRTPVVFAYINNLTDSVAENNSMIIIIVIATVSAIAFGALLVFKKKKHN